MSDPSHSLRVGPDAEPDRYSLGPVVDSGAEGVLYRGSRTTAGIELDVAIKVLHPCFASRVEDWYRRWDDQVQLLLSLQVPGVVGVRDGFLGPLPHPPGKAGEDQTLYLVMNWVEGEPLHEWVHRRPDRDPLEALKLLLGVASALDVIHSGQLTAGVPLVHCDVKPSNILVTAHGTVLVDFGLIRALPDGPRLSRVTGTRGYVAPEVEAGIYTVAADRYALGAVAYFVLTGTEPPLNHQAGALRASLAAIPALAGHPDVVDHVMAMLDEDPDARPPALANWVGRLRRSSVPDLLVGLAPEAPGRNPSTAPATSGPPRRAGRPVQAHSRRQERGLDVVHRAGELGKELSALAESLYGAETDGPLACVYGWTDLKGSTGQHAREIVELLSSIWVQYLVAKDVVDQLDAAVAENRLSDAERLLGPGAIDLPDGTATSAVAHIRDLQQRLRGIGEAADRLMATVERRVSSLAAATNEVEDLVRRATALGIADEALVAAGVTALEEAASGLVADSATAVETEKLQEAIEAARRYVEGLERRRENLPAQLAEAASTLQDITRIVAEGRDSLRAARVKIAEPSGLLEPVDPAVVDGDRRALRPWLARIASQAEAGDWRSASTGLESWRRVAGPVLADARRIAEENRAPISRRNELRGLLRSYRAKAVTAGRAEDLVLARLHQTAADALYVEPCDLASAEAKVRTYLDAVNARPVARDAR